jgi:hypothetical protein
MAHILRLKQTYRRNQNGITDVIGAAARAVAEDHELALRATDKAALPRKNLAELRAMYVSTSETPPDSAVEKTSSRAVAAD